MTTREIAREQAAIAKGWSPEKAREQAITASKYDNKPAIESLDAAKRMAATIMSVTIRKKQPLNGLAAVKAVINDYMQDVIGYRVEICYRNASTGVIAIETITEDLDDAACTAAAKKFAAEISDKDSQSRRNAATQREMDAE